MTNSTHNSFENMANYKIIKKLYDTQEDFIVIGLCGKTGSGCTTAAEMLQKSFKELDIRDHIDSNYGLYEQQEYNLLYKFAKVNWRPFHRVKTSALITATTLSDSSEDLLNFLYGLIESVDYVPEAKIKEKIECICKRFFNRKMDFDLNKWFYIENIGNQNYKEWFEETFNEDNLLSKLEKVWENNAQSKEKQTSYDQTQKELDKEQEELASPTDQDSKQESDVKGFSFGLKEDNQIINIQIEYSKTDNMFRIANKELYKLFKCYMSKRKAKSNFGNPVYFYILQQYIYDFLPNISAEFWKEIDVVTNNLSILAMQLLGIYLRIYRKPYSTDKDGNTKDVSIAEDGFYSIAERINYSIKILSSYQTKRHNLHDKYKEVLKKSDEVPEIDTHTLVVIDSIKNPFESQFLKQRYSNYYLLGLYTENSQRTKRLDGKDIRYNRQKDIETIEVLSEFKAEYKKWEDKKLENSNERIIVTKLFSEVKEKNLHKVLPFVLQNVASCLDIADIFINNVKDSSARLILKEKLVRYVSLIMHPGLILPTKIERCMQLAYTAKVNSGCLSRQVGAVITDSNYHLLSIGWNQQPEGQLPCSYRNLNELFSHKNEDGNSDFENNDEDEHGFLSRIQSGKAEFQQKELWLEKNGKLPYYCFKDIYNKIEGKQNQVHPRSLHAEETAFLNLGPTGKMQVQGGCLFTTSSPCELCSKKAKYMQVSKIYYVEPYSGISHPHVLNVGNDKTRPEFILFTGAIGRAYMQLYTPIIPLKDEHELWLGGKLEDILINKENAENKPERDDNAYTHEIEQSIQGASSGGKLPANSDVSQPSQTRPKIDSGEDKGGKEQK